VVFMISCRLVRSTSKSLCICLTIHHLSETYILVCLFVPFSPLSGRLLVSSSLRREGVPLNPQHYSRPLMILSMTMICESCL
jgi:hypothetical protein